MTPLGFALPGFSFPNINPIAVSIGPLKIHWYGLGYIVGISFAWWYSKFLLNRPSLWNHLTPPFSASLLDDLVLYATCGIILGGRLGYVIFYNLFYYMQHPLMIFRVWDGGMSFHGGFIGIAFALFLFSSRYRIPLWSLFDLIAVSCPIGLGLVRFCNFINSELWGHVTTFRFGVRFPNGGQDLYGNFLLRHPSQIYEALLEGVFLFSLMFFLTFKYKSLKKPGSCTSIFVIAYAVIRIFIEFFREPDAQLGYLFDQWLTMGMLLSIPMLAVGIWIFFRGQRR